MFRRGRDPSRKRLLKLLPKGSTGAEVGVWRGDFSAELLEKVKPGRLHLIDPWAFRGDYAGAWYGGAEATSQEDMDAIHGDVVERFAGRPVVVHRRPSDEVELDGLDWAYIDGDHTYPAVAADLANYGRMLRPGGILCGDDYGNPGWWEDGVTRAVDEFVERENYAVELMSGGQFALRKP
jgi:SAM-dependent methyltransferase